MADGTIGEIEFNYPIFPDNTAPYGALNQSKACQACWYYYILAEKQRTGVGSGPESQIIVVDAGRDADVHWMDKHYTQTVMSIALIYQVSVQDILNHWPLIIREAQRLGLPAPLQEYMYPRRWITQ